MGKLWDKITFLWAYWFAPRFIGIDYGQYDEEACVVWFKHKDKVYMTDYVIADALMGEPTEPAQRAGASVYWEQQTKEPGLIGLPQANEVFKAMRDKMLEDIKV